MYCLWIKIRYFISIFWCQHQSATVYITHTSRATIMHYVLIPSGKEDSVLSVVFLRFWFHHKILCPMEYFINLTMTIYIIQFEIDWKLVYLMLNIHIRLLRRKTFLLKTSFEVSVLSFLIWENIFSMYEIVTFSYFEWIKKRAIV